ncbi:MAG: outer membrane beta-barrel family protein [Caulobacteraceae bacterium]
MPGAGQLKVGYDLRDTDTYAANYALFGANAAAATLNPLYTNVFHYDQLLNAGYVTYEKPLGPLTMLAGLRVEDERLGVQQRTQSMTVDRDELGVFPTLHLGYKQNANVTWIANYSLRIQRPQPQDLNPTGTWTDPFNIRVGNPLLESEKTHSFEAGWQYRKGATSYLATAFYRQSDGGGGRTWSPTSAAGVLADHPRQRLHWQGLGPGAGGGRADHQGPDLQRLHQLLLHPAGDAGAGACARRTKASTRAGAAASTGR